VRRRLRAARPGADQPGSLTTTLPAGPWRSRKQVLNRDAHQLGQGAHAEFRLQLRAGVGDRLIAHVQMLASALVIVLDGKTRALHAVVGEDLVDERERRRLLPASHRQRGRRNR
jgi:hypothetical protein